jgi:anti-anti-sigma regulatory factor
MGAAMNWRKWFEPRSKDERTARQEQLVNILSLAAGMFALLYVVDLVVVAVLSPEGVHIASFIGAGLALLLTLGSYALSRSGRVRAGAVAITTAALLIALYSGYVRGAMSASAIMTTLAVLFAGLAVGGPAGAIVAVVELALYTLLTLAQVRGWIPGPLVTGSPETGMVLIVSCLGVIALAIWLTIRAFEAVIRQAEERGRRLQTLADDKDRLLDELQARDEVQRRLLETVRELGSPVIPLAPGVIALPLIGTMDDARIHQVISALLQGVSHHRARVVIVDITGVSAVDTGVAGALLKAAQGVRLLGATAVLTGIRAEVAQNLVALGLDLSTVVTRATLQEGLAFALNAEGKR